MKDGRGGSRMTDRAMTDLEKICQLENRIAELESHLKNMVDMDTNLQDRIIELEQFKNKFIINRDFYDLDAICDRIQPMIKLENRIAELEKFISLIFDEKYCPDSHLKYLSRIGTFKSIIQPYIKHLEDEIAELKEFLQEYGAHDLVRKLSGENPDEHPIEELDDGLFPEIPYVAVEFHEQEIKELNAQHDTEIMELIREFYSFLNNMAWDDEREIYWLDEEDWNIKVADLEARLKDD
jgi:hypothetical protein